MLKSKKITGVIPLCSRIRVPLLLELKKAPTLPPYISRTDRPIWLNFSQIGQPVPEIYSGKVGPFLNSKRSGTFILEQSGIP